MNTPLPLLFLDFASRERVVDDIYVVGGAVRDLLIEKEIKDLDLAVEGDALSLARRFAGAAGGSFVLLDESFCAARVVLGGRIVDLTALRGGSIDADLAGRDLTINAMALPLSRIDGALSGPGSSRSALVIDPFLGKEDLARGIIRMVAEENLRSDPLRLLRAYRFAATLGFTIEETTGQSLRSLSPLITTVAAERIAEELRAIFGTERSAAVVGAMARDGLLTALFPALSQGPLEEALPVYEAAEKILNNFEAAFPGHAGAVAASFAAGSRRRGLKMAALFSRSSGALHEAGLQLKLSVKERDVLQALETRRLSIMALCRSGGSDAAAFAALIKEQKENLYALFSLALAEAEALQEPAVRDACRRLLDRYHEEFVPRLGLLPLITGSDLITVFGLAPSPLFGEILDAIARLVLEGKIAAKEEALAVVKEVFLTRKDAAP